MIYCQIVVSPPSISLKDNPWKVFFFFFNLSFDINFK